MFLIQAADRAPTASHVGWTWSRRPTLIALALITVVSVVVAIGLGPIGVAPPTVLRIIVHHVIGVFDAESWARTDDAIIWEVRLPRVLLGAIVGAALGVVGVTLQALVRNPLADRTSTGGVEVSVEAIVDFDPDIVIGYDTATITHDALADVGIQLYVMPPFCDNPPTPSFESILDEVRFYGELFGTTETANASAAALEAAVASAADAPVADGQTSAALYVSSDGSAIYAYSSLGMVHPLMEALGMTNVFAELGERVPEVSIEEVIGRNPEILVLLYDDFGLTPDEISTLVTDLPGANSITAVEQGAVYPLLFNFAEPPTPLVVKGLSELSAQITE